MEQTYLQIVSMITNSCDIFYKGTNYDGIHLKILECATQIYIKQMELAVKEKEEKNV